MLPIHGFEMLARIADRWIATFPLLALKGALLLGLLWAITRALRRSSAAARHMIWVWGMTALLLLPLLETMLPAWSILPVPDLGSSHAATRALRGGEPGGGMRMDGACVDAALGAEAPGAGAWGVSARDRTDDVGLTTLGTRDTVLNSPAPGGERGSGATLKSLLSPLATVGGFSLWLWGGLLLTAAFLRGLFRLRALRREARPLVEDGWPELLQALSGELRLGTLPVLLCSPRRLSPMTWGLRRAVVLLPEDCRGWTSAQRREVLLHELAHVRRRDALLQLVSHLVCLVYWFNPLVWFAARCMRAERERACDDQVLLAGIRPSSYARHLLEIASGLGSGEGVLSAGLALARRSRVFARLDAVLDPRRRRVTSVWRAALVSAALSVALLLPLAAMSPVAQAREKHALASPPRLARGDRPPALLSLLPSLPSPPALLPSLPSLPPLPRLPVPEEGLLTLRGVRDGSRVTWTCEDEETTLRLEMDGRIEFNPTGTGIVAMGEDAYLSVERKVGRERVRITAEPDAEGRPVFEYRVDGQIRPFDEAAAAALADLLERVALQTGEGVSDRVRRAYARARGEAVEALIDRVTTSYAKAVYYREYLALPALRDEEIERALASLPDDLESEFERAAVLSSFVQRPLGSARVRHAFQECFASFASEYQKARILADAFGRATSYHDDLVGMLAALQEIASDVERGCVLKAVEPEWLREEGFRRAYLEAFGDTASDHEKAQVLLELARDARREAALRALYEEAAEAISSDYEYARVMRALR